MSTASRDAAVEFAVDRDRLLRAIADASRALLELEDNYAAGMDRCLGAVGAALEVDRVYVFEAHEDASGVSCCSQRFEWSRDVVAPQIDNPELQGVPFEALGDWEENLRAERPMGFLVADYEHEAVREILEAQDIVSILVVPVTLRDELWGFVGFDDCTRARSWREPEVAALTALAGAVGAAMVRSRVHQAVLELSSPILQVWDGVVAVPLVGRLTPDRAANLLESLLDAIQIRRVSDVLLDITGMSAIAVGELELILRAVRAARLLGARTILVGVSPQVAQALVASGSDISGLVTRQRLEDGLAEILAGRGLRLSRKAGRSREDAS